MEIYYANDTYWEYFHSWGVLRVGADAYIWNEVQKYHTVYSVLMRLQPRLITHCMDLVIVYSVDYECIVTIISPTLIA